MENQEMLQEKVDMINHLTMKLNKNKLCKNQDVKYLVMYSNIEANPISFEKFYVLSRQSTQYQSLCT